MAFRSIIRPLNLTSRPVSRISLVRSIKSPYNTAVTSSPKITKSTENIPLQDKPTSNESDSKAVNKDDSKAVNKEETMHGYAYGAHHWNMERASAITLIPLISTQFIYGAHPIVDGLMGVVLPYHIYMGFDSCITDYIPKRNYPRLHRLANWTLMGSTGLVMWGCYEFNTNDIGFTEFLQRLFTA
ncbi:MAG: CybS-domain-containing protein [Benjaminiella poitrasii]|nr:MAG: CybS-domain-containing protein [Benjaminiella poitrasii]